MAHVANDSHADPAFSVIEVVRDPDGVVAVVTERKRDGRISFMIAREYDQKDNATGEMITRRSSYLNNHHLPAVRRLLVDLEDRLEIIEDRARTARREKSGG